MKVLKLIAVLLAVGMFTVPAMAQDTCATADAVAPLTADPCADLTAEGPLGLCTGGGGLLDQWVSFVAPATSTRVRTDLGSTGTDSEFIVWDACGGNKIGCASDISSSNWLGNTCVGGLTVGATYYVQVGTYADGCPNGPYVVDIEIAGTCGDSVVDCGEGCDPPGTCCSATCQNNAVVCGDSVICGLETCDDGNAVSGDGCSSICRIEIPICGDNMVNQPSEQCDGTANAACIPGSEHCSTDCLCHPGIPAVSEWGLAVLLLIGLVSGTILFGRRRAVAH